MNSIALDAPAKINLYLDVLSRRKDGYHNIATIFQRIDLADRVKISKAKKGITLGCRGIPVPKGKTNLAYKAAHSMITEFELNTGLKININKKIPVAAGLGGGSSDAASVILGINRLFCLKASRARLIKIAKAIGADVPFFVSGYRSAIGRGIGERLKELKHKFRTNVVLVVPNIKIYTKTIYNSIKIPLTKPALNVNMLAHILSGKNRDKAKALSLYNRFEDIVFASYPVTKRTKDILSFYADKTLLSGSGPTIFGLFNERKEARKAAAEIQKKWRWKTVLTEIS